METVTQRRVPAASAKFDKPAAPASVFDIGRQASQSLKAARAATRVEVDIDSIQILKDVPVPEAKRGGQSKYKELFARMQPGDSVVLPSKAALSMVAAAKKLGIKTAHRALGDGNSGVWKLK